VEVSAGELAARTGGAVVAGDTAARAESFAIDSRVLGRGACFVALVAERDGHDFVADAFARGATVALVARPVSVDPPVRGAVVQVADPLAALGGLGAAARDALGDALVVGITGSAGKTGTKDLTAAALGGPPAVHASPGSYNNEAGVPLTLLDAPSATEAVVLEMGARARGDIAALCAIARPTAGVITNIGLAHAGPLGGPAGVARAKGELFEALPAHGVAVLDALDAAAPTLAARTTARVLRVAVGDVAGADVRATAVAVDELLHPSFVIESAWGRAPVRLAVHGDHQVVNALLAAAVAFDAGRDVAAVVAGLESVRPARWRMEVLRTKAGGVVVNDAYNANPASTAAALRALAGIDTDGRRVAVLGDMRELGAHSAEEHARIGRLAAELGVDVVVAVGPETGPLVDAAAEGSVAVMQVPDAAGALDALTTLVGPADIVLVKGSRAVGLEDVVRALVDDASERVAGGSTGRSAVR
jgi:UDP-N-acetylmuramoyl-tripeptide--D-alanyl-D-alanine ligase